MEIDCNGDDVKKVFASLVTPHFSYFVHFVNCLLLSINYLIEVKCKLVFQMVALKGKGQLPIQLETLRT